jgi:hypothetical protein
MAAHRVKGRPFIRNTQTIDLTKSLLMDLRAKRVAYFFIESVVDATGVIHRLYILIPIFELLPSNNARNGHNGAGQRPARFPPPCHTPGKSASRLKNFRASHMQFFLQSCKNGLGSTEIGHVILKRRLEDLIQKSFPIVHKLLLV